MTIYRVKNIDDNLEWKGGFDSLYPLHSSIKDMMPTTSQNLSVTQAGNPLSQGGEMLFLKKGYLNLRSSTALALLLSISFLNSRKTKRLSLRFDKLDLTFFSFFSIACLKIFNLLC